MRVQRTCEKQAQRVDYWLKRAVSYSAHNLIASSYMTGDFWLAHCDGPMPEVVADRLMEVLMTCAYLSGDKCRLARALCFASECWAGGLEPWLVYGAVPCGDIRMGYLCVSTHPSRVG